MCDSCAQGVLVTSYVLLMELFPTPYQVQASVCLVAFGMVSTVMLPLLMWIIKSWRYVQLAVSAPGVVFLAHVWCVHADKCDCFRFRLFSYVWCRKNGPLTFNFTLVFAGCCHNHRFG